MRGESIMEALNIRKVGATSWFLEDHIGKRFATINYPSEIKDEPYHLVFADAPYYPIDLHKTQEETRLQVIQAQINNSFATLIDAVTFAENEYMKTIRKQVTV